MTSKIGKIALIDALLDTSSLALDIYDKVESDDSKISADSALISSIGDLLARLEAARLLLIASYPEELSLSEGR